MAVFFRSFAASQLLEPSKTDLPGRVSCGIGGSIRLHRMDEEDRQSDSSQATPAGAFTEGGLPSLTGSRLGRRWEGSGVTAEFAQCCMAEVGV